MSQIKLHNNFEIRVEDTSTGEVITGRGENVVLNTFYELALSANGHLCGFSRLFIGSGTSAPDPSQTNLDARWAALSTNNTMDTAGWNISEYKVGGTGVIHASATVVLQATEYIGEVIAEVGLGTTLSGSPDTTITRSLLQDANGNPLVITKTGTMIVTIYATVFMTFPKEVSGFKLVQTSPPTIPNNNQTSFFSNNFKLRPVRVGASWFEPKDVGQLSSPETSLSATETLDLPNQRRNYAYSNIAAGVANHGGLRSMIINGIEIPIPNNEITQPVINKEVVGTGDGVKTAFTTKFGWIRDNGTLKVYVNDVEQVSGVRVNYNTPSKDHTPYYVVDTGTRQATYDVVVENKCGKAIKYVKNNTVGSVVNYMLKASDSKDGPWENVLFNPTQNVETLIPEAFQSKLYWLMPERINWFLLYSEEDVIFDSPPPAGSTITVTYQPDCIAKDDTKIINNISYSLGL